MQSAEMTIDQALLHLDLLPCLSFLPCSSASLICLRLQLLQPTGTLGCSSSSLSTNRSRLFLSPTFWALVLERLQIQLLLEIIAEYQIEWWQHQ
jgi:hypothetical protein